MIKAENITVSFKSGLKKPILALKNFSLTVNEGDFFSLLGQNGAGKSTAMYCFLGLIKPTKGAITLMGKPLELGSSLYRQVAYLPEEPHYHMYLTVEEAIEFYGSLYGEPVKKKRVNELLDQMGLTNFRQLRLDRCSKGMRQKVGFAQCLVHNPKILFLDEPTRGLDPIIVKEIRDILKTLNNAGTTIIMNSHVLSEVELISNRAAIIDKGHLIREDSIQNFIHTSSDLYEVEFIYRGKIKLPTYIENPTKSEELMKGVINKEDLHKFMAYMKKSKSELHKCSLMKKSLEDSIYDLLKGSS